MTETEACPYNCTCHRMDIDIFAVRYNDGNAKLTPKWGTARTPKKKKKD